MRRAVNAWHEHQADVLIGETNFGGEMIDGLARNVDPCVPFRKVVASRGKAIRAEPVSALFEQGRVHLGGVSPSSRTSCAPGRPPTRARRTGMMPSSGR